MTTNYSDPTRRPYGRPEKLIKRVVQLETQVTELIMRRDGSMAQYGQTDLVISLCVIHSVVSGRSGKLLVNINRRRLGLVITLWSLTIDSSVSIL